MKYLSKNKGFSIIEMIVSIGIVSMILAVIVFNQGDFNDRLSLSTNANDLELYFRQAQIYGISVKEFSPASGEFTSPYGISVNKVTGNDGTFFTLFADRGVPNGIYDGDSTCSQDIGSECIKSVVFSRGITIEEICAEKPNGEAECAPNVGRADITFVRPNPAANVILFNQPGNLVNIGNVIAVRIRLLSPKGNRASVYVYTTGQISIQNN